MRMNYIIPEYRHLIVSNLCSVLNTSIDGLYVTDRHGMTIAINRTYEQLSGLKAKDVLGKNIKDLVDDGTFDTALNPDIVTSGKSMTRVQVTSKGRRVLLVGHPIFDYDEDVELVVTFVRDVTVMSRFQSQINHQRDMIEKFSSNIQKLSVQKQIITESPLMQKLLGVLDRVASTDATVLLLGETGVGKDVLAHRIHERSDRANKPFFKVDCTSIPENLIESELFGYVAGAFSGASSKGKAGFFEIADKGTLFLDEIGELPLPMQGRLLRALQDGEIVRVGSTQPRAVDVRIIAATNRDLEQEVVAGNFRSDLFYRLRVAVVHVPALRERQEDILPLIQFFLERFYQKYKKTIRLFPTAEEALLQYAWPGNVRELENLIHSLVVTSLEGVIREEDLPPAMQCAKRKLDNSAVGLQANYANFEGKSLKEIMAELEKDVLLEALKVHGSIAKVAKVMNVNRTTIFRKIRKYTDGEVS
ncbi:probable transcriptional regulatory protein (HydG) [Desulfotalea psychrophila LSv54]|uniref:HTH-type transcriptional regulatory protein TyrR n=2 Tax=Desulfotalea psychrophila TaxID=84980 RepID=Q6AIP5_DESPS|nr:probable transcriptional regulatory protein (HydG) [Desulfotalea psychrophila LSv54]